MAVNLIDPTLGSDRSNMGRSVTNYGSKTTFSKQYVSASGASYLFNLSTENIQEERSKGNWSLGTGVLINVTGTVLFDATGFGAALSEGVVINRGTGTVYIGCNVNTLSVASGLELTAGESYKFQDGIVLRLTAITNNGFATVVGEGTYLFNSNTV